MDVTWAQTGRKDVGSNVQWMYGLVRVAQEAADGKYSIQPPAAEPKCGFDRSS